MVVSEPAVIDTWHAFMEHVGECAACELVREGIVADLWAGEGKHAFRPRFAQACPTGEQLLWAWDTACQDAVGASGRAAKRLGVWKDGPDREDRVQAIMALPDREFWRLLEVEPEERRMAEVDALTRAYRRTRMVVVPQRRVENPNVCPECGKEVKPGGMGLHRARAHRLS